MKIEINPIFEALRQQYLKLEREYTEECAIDFMSRRATYLDGQLAALYKALEMLEDAKSEAAQEEEEIPDYDPDDFAFEDDVDESNYDPYMGCDSFDC